jgi:putative two-component system response regulator
MATAVSETVKAVEAMKLGAYDYVIKPFDVNMVVTSVHRALERRQLRLENKEYHDRLEEKVLEKTAELVEMNAQLRHLFLNTVQSLVHTLEAKDKYTEGHSRRVAKMAETMAKHLRFTDSQLERIHLAAILHDIGKIGVREACLNKPGRLTPAEYDEVKQHPLISERILKPIEALEDILPNIRHHHERFDGKGYPSGLRGTDIPIGSRILSVADSYDAMTSDRPYRRALSVHETLEELKRNTGTQFDPELVTLFLSIHEASARMLDDDGERPVSRPTPSSVFSL